MTDNSDKIDAITVAYQESLAEKRHYDILSWTIGAVVLIFIGALSAYIFQIKISEYWFTVLKRGGAAIFGIVLSYLWLIEYMREIDFMLKLQMKRRGNWKSKSMWMVWHTGR